MLSWWEWAINEHGTSTVRLQCAKRDNSIETELVLSTILSHWRASANLYVRSGSSNIQLLPIESAHPSTSTLVSLKLPPQFRRSLINHLIFFESFHLQVARNMVWARRRNTVNFWFRLWLVCSSRKWLCSRCLWRPWPFCPVQHLCSAKCRSWHRWYLVWNSSCRTTTTRAIPRWKLCTCHWRNTVATGIGKRPKVNSIWIPCPKHSTNTIFDQHNMCSDLNSRRWTSYESNITIPTATDMEEWANGKEIEKVERTEDAAKHCCPFHERHSRTHCIYLLINLNDTKHI